MWCHCCQCCHSQMCCNKWEGCSTQNCPHPTIQNRFTHTDTTQIHSYSLVSVSLWFLMKSVIVHNVCVLKPKTMLYTKTILLTCSFKTVTLLYILHHRPQVDLKALICLLTIGQSHWHKLFPPLCSLLSSHMTLCQNEDSHRCKKDTWCLLYLLK